MNTDGVASPSGSGIMFTEHSPTGSAGKSKVETTQGALSESGGVESESGSAHATPACCEESPGLSDVYRLFSRKKKVASQSDTPLQPASAASCGLAVANEQVENTSEESEDDQDVEWSR